ncbi:MAG: protoporphyrinogen oxidase [Sorangiineae bacterium NIC37A_2]|jgi:oxygen-dependent protoporphyrinogen oxidase|nr:MAG: protoporphyrinogen oxidase [Sorangiineae bacterium NIC37A_2]
MQAFPRVFDVLIVGGGVSGLALSYYLKRRGLTSLLIEKGPRFGGNIRTQEHDGFLYDVGPDSFVRSKPEAEALCRELGLGKALIVPSPEGRHVYVAYEGQLHSMPEGLSLGVPTRPLALLETKLLSDLGKGRACLEPFVPPAEEATEESIFDFLARRLGPEMAERIAAPLLGGVFAGDARRLSMQAAFPQLIELEKAHGSLFFGLKAPRSRSSAPPLSLRDRAGLLWRALREEAKSPPSPFLSLERGLGQFIEALVDELDVMKKSATSPGTGSACARLGEPVTRLLRSGNRVTGVRLDSGEELTAETVVIAGPPWAAAELLRGTLPGLSERLSQIHGAPTATVFFGFDLDFESRRLTGSGFIVPPGEGEILAATWVDQKWAGRAPPGAGLVRAFLGGARRVGPNPLAASDDELISLARRELVRFMGPLGRERFARVYRYAHGTPQPELGHLERVAAIEESLSHVRGLHLTGAGYGGVGIPDCVRGALDLATLIADGSSTSFHTSV